MKYDNRNDPGEWKGMHKLETPPGDYIAPFMFQNTH